MQNKLAWITALAALLSALVTTLAYLTDVVRFSNDKPEQMHGTESEANPQLQRQQITNRNMFNNGIINQSSSVYKSPNIVSGGNVNVR